MNTRTFMIAGAVGAAAVAGYLLLGGQQPSDSTAIVPGVGEAAAAETPAETLEALKAKGYLIGDAPQGDASAPVTIIEYSSLTCPHCRRLHESSLPQIKTDYIDAGKAKIVVREVIFDRLGLYAAAVARCSGDPKSYHAFISIFFEKQREWSLGADDANVARGVQVLRRLGTLGGMTGERIDGCLTDNDYLQHIYDTYRTNAERDEIRSTPTLLIGDQRIVGAESAENIAAAIDAASN